MTHQEEKEKWVEEYEKDFYYPFAKKVTGSQKKVFIEWLRSQKEESFKEGQEATHKEYGDYGERMNEALFAAERDAWRAGAAELLEKLEEEVKSIEKENSSDVNPYKQAFFEGGNEALKQVHQILSQHKI